MCNRCRCHDEFHEEVRCGSRSHAYDHRNVCALILAAENFVGEEREMHGCEHRCSCQYRSCMRNCKRECEE